MKSKDFYEILELERTADDSEIRAAFRRLAKLHHPDLSGSEETYRFREILHAYSVLSDPEDRASYDERLRREEEAERAELSRSTYARGFVRPMHHPGKSDFGVSGGILNDAVNSPFSGFGRPRKARVDVEVVLSLEEARRGGMLPLLQAGIVSCPACRGGGRGMFVRCSLCLGRGIVENDKPLWIKIPAGICDGSLLELPIQSRGTVSAVLHIIVRVGIMDGGLAGT